jgi:hypothetical protein
MAAPQQPRSITVVMDLGFRSDPNMHRTQSGPFRVRIEARQRGWRHINLLSTIPERNETKFRATKLTPIRNEAETKNMFSFVP